MTERIVIGADGRKYITTEPAPVQAQSEPVNWNWVDLQNRADEIVRGKVLWKRFIDGTPLANDIACWMADFAQEVAAAPVQHEELKRVVDRTLTRYIAELEAQNKALLEALKMLLSYTKACEGVLNCTPAGQIGIAEAAIAKATGEAK